MKLLVASVRDIQVERFLPPMYFRNMGECLRAMGDACADASHQFAQHGEVFWLYRLGEFDDETGLFELEDAPVYVAKCSELAPRPSLPAQRRNNNGPVVDEDPADQMEMIDNA